MKYFNLTNFFVSMSGGDTFSIKKPNPKHIFYTLEKGGINPDNLGIFIGDSKYDYLCAKKMQTGHVYYILMDIVM